MTKDRRINFLRSAALACTLLVTLGAAPAGVTLSGTTDASVIWLDDPAFAPVTGHEVEIRNRDREFLPELTVVPAGTLVRFPNDDSYYHSIYSDNGPNPFDIGYYGNGPGKIVPMNKTGVTIVHCHIHARMFAAIIVVDGPSAQAANGSYTLSNVAPGSYTLHAWNREKGEKTMTVTVGASGATQNVTL